MIFMADFMVIIITIIKAIVKVSAKAFVVILPASSYCLKYFDPLGGRKSIFRVNLEFQLKGWLTRLFPYSIKKI